MNIEARDSLRNSVIEKLMTAFPTAQKVSGGVAFISDVLDDETGKFFPVEVKVSVKNTADTARGTAYDLEAAVAEYAAKPGRRVADPAKKAAEEARKAASAEKKAAAIAAIKEWAKTARPENMSATEIKDAVPALANEQPMYVGACLKAIVEEGALNVALSTDGKHKKLYSFVG